jgi:DNA-directed RNA polymerase specialized sigma24 family protein
VEDLVAVVSSVEPFDRIVYVLSVLEGISVRECALLLDCSVHQVMHARTRALRSTSNLRRQKHPNHGTRSVEKVGSNNVH